MRDVHKNPIHSPSPSSLRQDRGRSDSVGHAAYADRMRELFEKSVSQATAKMGEFLTSRNAPGIMRQAHSILNSAVVVRAADLADLARAIESKAKASNMEDIETDYQRLLTFNLAEIIISVPAVSGSGT